jgi:Cellulose binding domain
MDYLGRHDRASQRASPGDLVRPYVLGPGDHAARHPGPAEPASPHTPAGRVPDGWAGQPAGGLFPGSARAGFPATEPSGGPSGGWAHDPALLRLPDDAAVPGWPEMPASSRSAGPERARRASRPGHRRPAGQAWRRWPGAGARKERRLARPRPAAVLGLGAGVLALVGGVLLLVTAHGSRGLAGNCGAAPCSPAVSRAAHRVTPSAAVPAMAVHPRPSVTPSATPAASLPSSPPSVLAASSSPPAPSAAATSPATQTATRQPVVVVYTLVRSWNGGIQGELTIVNDGSTAITSWELSVTLSGDQIDSVGDTSYQAAGATLVLDARAGEAPIAPGASLSEYFTASGPTTSPSSCTFNGTPC